MLLCFLLTRTGDTGLVGSDGSALDTDVVLLAGLSCVEGDLIVGSITVLHTEIEVLDVEIEVGVDELWHVKEDSGTVSSHFSSFQVGLCPAKVGAYLILDHLPDDTTCFKQKDGMSAPRKRNQKNGFKTRNFVGPRAHVPGHLITVHLDDGVGNLNLLRHVGYLKSTFRNEALKFFRPFAFRLSLPII